MKKILAHSHFIPWCLFIFFTSIYFSSTVGGMNSGDGSQYALTQAIVEEKTFQIDSFKEWTYDTDYIYSKNHFYSDRDPGVSFLAIPFYIWAKIIFPLAKMPYDGNNPDIDNASTLQSLTYLTTAVFAALGVTIFYLLCRRLGNSLFVSIISTLAVGLGTLLWKYSTSFYREPVYTLLLLLSFYLLFKLHPKLKLNKNSRIFVFVGFLSGLAVFVDYSKIFIILVFLIYLLFIKVKKTVFISYATGLFLPLSLMFLYRFTVTSNPIVSQFFYHQNLKWLYNPTNLFQTPLIPSVITNLFSSGPISKDVLSFFWKNPEFDYQLGAKYAVVYQYKGIFTQTPLLYVTIIGWIFFLKKNFREAVFILGIAIISLVSLSKMTHFWATNIYDTRYFLPVSVTLLIGLPFYIDKIKHEKLWISRWIHIAILVGLMAVSTYNGWYSNLTNFAPHVSGEHRFSFTQLQQPFLGYGNFKNNLWLLFINTFPNIYNIHLLFIFYFFPILLIYLLYKFYVYLLSPRPKRLFLKNKKYRAGLIWFNWFGKNI